MWNVKIIIFLFLISYLSHECQASVTTDMEILADPNLILNAINRFIQDEQIRIDDIKRLSNKLKTLASSQNISSPDLLSIYLLTKTLTDILSEIKDQVDIQDYKIISDDDPINAAQALFRLQDTYDISVQDMADNNLIANPSPNEKLQMTAFNCFQLGLIAFNVDPPDYYHALLWLQESYDRLEIENQANKKTDVDKKNILVYLSLALNHQDNLERAYILIERLKKLDPHFPMVDENLKSYTKKLKSASIPLDDLENRLPPLRLNREFDSRFPDTKIYESLCRGELEPLERQKSKKQLFCYYKIDKAYLKLARLKAELLHVDPRIVVFRNALSTSEAETIKRLAKAKLARSVISTTSQLDVSKYRTSKTAWLEDSVDDVIATVSKRIQDMTGLSCTNSENLQVANYELGGHYMPHFDFAGDEKKHQFVNLGMGDRMATILFYLSNTQAGGATVFPKLHLTIYPQEHDALFWYNLHPNGKGDRRTRHAACPVLLGVKWISNKWLHEYGQEFNRPCGLYEDD